MLIALDIGTNAGYCITDKGEYVESGVIKLKGKRFEKTRQYRMRLTQLSHRFPINEVAIEDVHNTIQGYTQRGQNNRSKAQINKHTVMLYYYLQGAIEDVFAPRGTPISAYPVSTVKAQAAGHGRADKPKMVEAANIAFSRRITDDNEADACCIAITHQKLGHKKEHLL